jgi:hypothetical protein
MIKLSAYERETIILFNEAEDTAQIDVYNVAMKNQLESLRRERPDEVSFTRGDKYSSRYIIPKKWIKINPLRTATKKQHKHLAQARANIGR